MKSAFRKLFRRSWRLERGPEEAETRFMTLSSEPSGRRTNRQARRVALCGRLAEVAPSSDPIGDLPSAVSAHSRTRAGLRHVGPLERAAPAAPPSEAGLAARYLLGLSQDETGVRPGHRPRDGRPPHDTRTRSVTKAAGAQMMNLEERPFAEHLRAEAERIPLPPRERWAPRERSRPRSCP